MKIKLQLYNVTTLSTLPQHNVSTKASFKQNNGRPGCDFKKEATFEIEILKVS